MKKKLLKFKGWAIVEPISGYPLFETFHTVKQICENKFLMNRKDWEGNALEAWKELQKRGYRTVRFEFSEITKGVE